MSCVRCFSPKESMSFSDQWNLCTYRICQGKLRHFKLCQGAIQQSKEKNNIHHLGSSCSSTSQLQYLFLLFECVEFVCQQNNCTKRQCIMRPDEDTPIPYLSVLPTSCASILNIAVYFSGELWDPGQGPVNCPLNPSPVNGQCQIPQTILTRTAM